MKQKSFLRSMLVVLAALMMSGLSFYSSVALTAEKDPFKTITSIGFGRDGATNTVFPEDDSEENAELIYKALGGRSKKVEIESEMGKFSLEASSTGIDFKIADPGENLILTEKRKQNVAFFKMSVGDVEVKGIIAEVIFDSLKVKATMREGGSSKSAGNLICMSALVGMAVKKISCQLKNVAWLTL